MKTKICDYCGTVWDEKETYCKKCSNPLPVSATDINEPVIDGIENDKLQKFIGEKKYPYYKKMFLKTKGKNVFIQMNWAALLFGPHWFFYRKMTKAAFAFVLLTLVLNIVFFIAVPCMFSGVTEKYFENKEAYGNYVNSDLPFFKGDEIYVPSYELKPDWYYDPHPDYQAVKDNLINSQNQIRTISWICNALFFVISMGVRLFGNFIYRKHIIENIETDVGGTSKGLVFLSVGLAISISLLLALILPLIPAANNFNIAANSLYNWLA